MQTFDMSNKHRGEVLICSSGHFIPKGFEVLSLDDPIHIPSVLDELITSPDKFLITSRRLKRARVTVPSQFQTERPLCHQHIEGVWFLRRRF